MTDMPSGDVTEALRLIFNILDLSRDVDRNREDGAFRDAGGTIAYVFDASLFEVFVNPHVWRGTTTSLHGPTWAVGSQDTSGWADYVAQTALATMEYLVDGPLPGQERNAIYMTEWHRWELRWRVGTLRDEYVGLLRRAKETDVVDRFAEVEHIRQAEHADPATLAALAPDPLLAADLRDFAEADASDAEMKSYAATRVSLAVLAADRFVEPVEQLRRLVSEPLRTGIRTFHLEPTFTPSEGEWQQIYKEARGWFDTLLAECAIKHVEVVRSSPQDDAEEPRRAWRDEAYRRRSEGALRDDARTLALVCWAARKAAAEAAAAHLSEDAAPGRGRAVVFVTADDVVFDAYRRWYANLTPQSDNYGDPFALRRLMQFAPTINLIDSGLVRGERYRELFKELLGVLETTLLPLNLSRLSSRTPATVLTRMREIMALRPLDRDRPIEDDWAYRPLVEALRRKGPDSFVAEMRSLLDRLRELERAALAQCDVMVDRRVQAVEKELAGLGAGGDGYDRSAAFERYVFGIIGDLRSSSSTMALPMAVEFINRWKPLPAGKGVRAPIALKLFLPIADGQVPVGDMLDDHLLNEGNGALISDSALTAMQHQPGLIFAIAAAQCAASGDWSNAQHFGEVASLAEEEQQAAGPAPQNREQANEINYLNALVRRFRMGEVGPARSPGALSRIERHYDAALSLLTRCANFHAGSAAEAQSLRVMRTLSERAALNLFYAASLSSTVFETGRFRQPQLTRHAGDGLDLRALAAIAEAERNLQACLGIDRDIRAGREPEERGRSAFLAIVRRQFITNIASASVLRFLMEGAANGSHAELQPTSREAVERVAATLEIHGETAHPLMRAELCGFLTLAGNEEARQALRHEAWPQAQRTSLYLDRAIFDAIKRHIAR